MAIEFQTNISLEATPSDPKHLVNGKWVQDYFTGRVKMPVRAISTVNIPGAYSTIDKTLTYSSNGVAIIDGITLLVNDRVLLIGQTNGIENGIYTLTTAGNTTTAAILTRADDFDASDKIYAGVRITVTEGVINADTDWKLTTDGTIILDTTALTFAPSYSSNATTKFSETITGDGFATDFDIVHDLGTTDVQVAIRNLVTNAMVMTDMTVTDSNTVTIGFAIAPTAAQTYRVTVIG